MGICEGLALSGIELGNLPAEYTERRGNMEKMYVLLPCVPRIPRAKNKILNTKNWQKLNELFAEALEISPNERAAFVAAVEDKEIRAELESLLKSHESSNKFLDKNAVELSARTLAEDEPEKLIGKQIGQF